MEIRLGARMNQGPVGEATLLVLDHRRQTQKQGPARLSLGEQIRRDAGAQAPGVAAAFALDARSVPLPL